MLSLPEGRREEGGEDNRFILTGVVVVVVETLGGKVAFAGDGGDEVAGFFSGVLDEHEDEEGDPEASDSTKETCPSLNKVYSQKQHLYTLLMAVASGGSTHSVGMTHGNMVPNFAARLIHPGACLPVSRLQRSSEK